MKIIEPRVSQSSALAYFERPRWSNLWGLLRVLGRITHSSSTAPKKGLPRIQLVWLPHFIVTVKVVSSKGPGEIDVSVEGHSGSFAIFQMHTNLVECSQIEGEVFPPRLREDEVVQTGRAELLKTILRQRGHRDKPAIVGTGNIDLFYYPFWIYYYERRRGLIDILVFDAARGVKGGARTKVGILSGLIGSDEAAREELDSHRPLG